MNAEAVGRKVEEARGEGGEGLTIEQKMASQDPAFAQALAAARGAAIRVQSSFRGMKGRKLEQDKRRARGQSPRRGAFP